MYHGSAPLLLTRLRLALQTLAENCIALACTYRLGEEGQRWYDHLFTYEDRLS
jgi:hypothetical protein